MRIVAVGTEPVGVIAIGANATGILAIGQLATGVFAVGQLARGGIVLGQLGLGLVAVGQLALGVGWSAGMLGIGATSGPGIVHGLFGRLYVRGVPAQSRRRGRLEVPVLTPTRVVVGLVIGLALAALWWVGAGKSLVHELTRPGGILVDPPHVLR